jgi:hypothetical protein
MPDASTIRVGDLILHGLAWRRVRQVERVPDPKPQTPRQRQNVIDLLRDDGMSEDEIARLVAKVDNPPRWVRLTVDVDGRPVVQPPVPPDWDMEVDRGDGEPQEEDQ